MTKYARNLNHPYVSLIIPAYNEEKRIRDSLIKVQNYINDLGYPVELLIVNDGSTDQTLPIATACLDGNPLCRILDYSPNKGKGYAVKKGVMDATGNYLLFFDADLSTPIEELENFLPTLQSGYDIVIGTRKSTQSNIITRQPLFRELLGKAFTLLSNILLVRGISDITCGFKAFKREVGQDIFSRQLISNWSFDAETLFLAQKLGYSIKEMPVTWCDAEGTKVRLARDILGSLKGMVRIRIHYLFDHYKLKSHSYQPQQ